MKLIEIKIPNDGLNNIVAKTKIIKWLIPNNSRVEKNQPLLKLENDYYELELPSSESGILHILKNEGDEVIVGDVICNIEKTK